MGTSPDTRHAGGTAPEPPDFARRALGLEALGLDPVATPPDVIRAMDTLRRIESGERFSAQEVSEVQRIMANETLAMQALTRLQRGLEELHSSTDPDQPKKIEGDD